MYIAFLHTKTCSEMIKYRTVNIGSNISPFKLEEFLDSLVSDTRQQVFLTIIKLN